MNAIEAIRPILGSLQSADLPRHEHPELPPAMLPFVTISRQGGAGGWTLAQRLVERLNEIDPDPKRPWSCWDRELVERVAADHHIAQQLIESLEGTHRTWLEEFLGGLTFGERGADPDELGVYLRVARTIRALARAGRVIVVGRGGACVTRGMPGGIHVRLVAPLDHRVQSVMREMKLDKRAATDHVRKLDRAREAFYRRYWPAHPLDAEMFTVTFNVAGVSDVQLVASLLPLVVPRAARRGAERRYAVEEELTR
jgi:cytidylate kinase